MVGAEHKSAYSIRTVGLECAIPGVAEAARLPTPPALRHRSTLEACGCAMRDPGGNHRIGPGFPSAESPRTEPTKVGDFLEEVELTRRRGYAIDDGEHEPGGRCVAAAVPGPALPAAVALSALQAHLDTGALGSVALSLTEVAQHLSADQEAPTP